MNIFFDLDGTLLDSRPRLYALFQHLVPNSKFSFDEYWNKKRNKQNHEYILKEDFGFNQNEIKKFQLEWMELIEHDDWLVHDKPFDGIENYLRAIENSKLFIVTARQFREKVISQVKGFGWLDIFTEILVTEQRFEKFDLINDKFAVSPSDWFIGDTGKDINTGKSLRMNTGAVLSGFLNYESLVPYKPDVIHESVVDFKFSNK